MVRIFPAHFRGMNEPAIRHGRHSAEFKRDDSISGITRVCELGLGCMELEFVRGVKMGEKTARAVHEVAEKLGIRLSVHAPYYINLNGRGRDA